MGELSALTSGQRSRLRVIRTIAMAQRRAKRAGMNCAAGSLDTALYWAGKELGEALALPAAQRDMEAVR
jgi:hypothetical protein